MQLEELTTLYQLIARGGGRSAASRQAMVLGKELCVRTSVIPRAGLGLFCTRRIRSGEWITAMDGVVCSGSPDPTQDQSHSRTLLHGALWLAGLKTSAPPHGVGGGSFANDAAYCVGSSHPLHWKPNNAEFKVVFDPAVPTLPVVFLVARRAIRPGEEITVSYGHDY